jgi:predicted Zn finger-like uncharacterized protein
MILTCPECATRFSTKAEAIGPNGRTVRCSQCSATWFAAADPDILSLNEIQQADTIKVDESLASGRDGGRGTDGDDFSIPEIGVAAPDETADDDAIHVGAHAVIRDKADRKKAHRRIFGVAMIWIVTMGLLIVAALIAWLFRAQIVEKFPATSGVYEALGIHADASGLEIYDVTPAHGISDGNPVLFVTGKVKNDDVRARDVPLIRLSFKNAGDEIVASWVVQPSNAQLSPGDSFSFSSQYPNPPIDATKLVSAFVDETSVIADIPIASQ